MATVRGTMMPVTAKAAGIYHSSILTLAEAKARGYDEAVLLSADGRVVERFGEDRGQARRPHDPAAGGRHIGGHNRAQ
ncbi:MAG: hypothetical protein JZD41_00575 [Thermoproteus sp.]|nr:hypothetical protein [Thermoproteus sp.]